MAINEELLQKWLREFKKGFSKPLLLKSLLSGPSYPYKMTKTIFSLTDGMISIATTNIYPILKDLTDAGLVTRTEEQETERTYYQITEEGRNFLVEVQKSMEHFFQIIIRYLKETP